MKVAVIGTGYVGLVTATCLADSGNDVVGIEKDSAKVRTVDEGRLPVALPSLISAGYGTGTTPCAVCDCGILSDQVIYEIDDPRSVDELLPFHFTCYVIWQRECAQRLATQK